MIDCYGGTVPEERKMGWLEKLREVEKSLSETFSVTETIIGPPEGDADIGKDSELLSEKMDYQIWEVERLAKHLRQQIDRISQKF